MKASLSTLAELGRGDLQAWAELADNAVEPNPFMHPDFVGLAAMALRPRGLRILRCEDAGGWAACLPVVPVAWRGDMLGPGLATWRHDYCYLGTPLLAAGAAADGALGLLAGARARRGSAFLACDWVRSGPVAESLTEASGAPPVITRSFTRGFVRRPAAPARAMAPLSRNRAKELRRQQRGLVEELGGDVEVVEHRDVPAAAQAFLDLELAGWKGRQGTAMACNRSHAAFLVAVCEAFAARDAVQFLSLQGGDRLASMQWNLRAGEAIFCLKVAYDEELSRHSPGMQLEVAALELLEQDERAAWMDSCADPDNELINRLWHDRTQISTLLIPGNPVGRVTLGATAAVMRVARRTRRRLLRSDLLRGVRDRLTEQRLRA